MNGEPRQLSIGVLGCGPIAQIAHFDACNKAQNARLYAICDVAEDLRNRMAAIYEPDAVYVQFEEMLNDPQVEAVIIGVADQYHVLLCLQAMDAGKHVLVEKPLGISVEECQQLRDRARKSNLILQVGNNRRFDPGISFAKKFVDEEIGQRMGFKAWYYDSTYRYTMTDNLQPIVHTSQHARRPEGNPKDDKRRYYILTHGSHIVDTARFLGGEITALRARLLERFGAYCWFVDVDFADGSLGHIDLTIAVRGDFEEGFQIYGQEGSVQGKVYLPWYHKSSYVECFSTKDRQFRRPLGEDAYSYKLQIESFSDAVLQGTPQFGATVDDGLAAMQAMVAIARSAQTGQSVRLADATGGV